MPAVYRIRCPLCTCESTSRRSCTGSPAPAAVGRIKRLTIGVADVEVASLLQLSLNAPVAYVRRVACDRDGAILYVGEGTYRGDAISREIDLR